MRFWVSDDKTEEQDSLHYLINVNWIWDTVKRLDVRVCVGGGGGGEGGGGGGGGGGGARDEL